jgi:PAS domain S-box-containing protein
MDSNALKEITILYVEDDSNTRESLFVVLKKIFKDVFVARNATQGRNLFDKLKDSNIDVDIVIGDIDILKEIDKIDKKAYLIAITKHTDKDFFLDAIKLGVKYCVIKPFDMVNLITEIEKVANLKQKSKIQEQQNKDNRRYIDIIDKVAIISKTDLSGNITFANDLFCEVSGYTREELIGANQRIVRHPDMDKTIFDSLWNTLREGKVWRNKLKNKAKNGEPYMVNATIFPVFDEETNEIVEYMAVRFMITEDEIKKRNFQKNVITNIQKQKQKEIELKKKIKELERHLKFLNISDVVSLQEALKDQRKKMSKIKKQISFYEEKIKYEQKENEQLTQLVEQKREDLIKINKEMKELARKHQDELSQLRLKSIQQASEIQRLTNELKEKKHTITA